MARGLFYSNDGSWDLMRHKAFGSYIYFSVHTKEHFDDGELLLLMDDIGDRRIEDIKPRWGSMDITTNLYQGLPGSSQFVFERRAFEARGWPLRSVWCGRTISVSAGIGRVITRIGPQGLIPIPFLPDYYWGPRGLPLYPIWTGFVVNMMFYAVLLWISFIARRIIRNKRGLCVTCAYDLRGAEHEACPECGTEIRKANPT